MDPYKVLGVSKEASTDDIKKAFRNLARETHPDFNPGNPEAEQRFKDINAAYEILSDPEKKQRHDNPNPFTNSNPFGFSGFPFGSPFSFSFGNFDPTARGPRQPIPPRGAFKGKNKELTVEVDILTLLLDNHISIRYRRLQPCPECQGRGSDLVYCKECDGYGFKREVMERGYQRVVNDTQCDRCHTSGIVKENSCMGCGGNGIREGEASLQLELDGSATYTIPGASDFGPYQGSPGDLVVHIKYKLPDRDLMSDEVKHHVIQILELTKPR